jgi:UDP-N-acetylglucosamine 2-epimerase (non-hydrolysing)
MEGARRGVPPARLRRRDRLRIACVVGARPNFVKMAPILAQMRLHPELEPLLIHTGQHYDASMSGSFFRDLEIPPPDVDLNVGPDTPAVQTATIMLRLASVCAEMRPDLAVVVGDVNSTLAAAITAVKTGIPLAHVEAGLRSFDRTMPEEVNRVLTDAVSDHCFTSEGSANENLAREGVPEERIHHVGNVMIDTLFRFRERAAASTILDRLGLERRRYAVLTLHRPSNVDDPSSLASVLRAVGVVASAVPVVFPVHPRTLPRLRPVPAAGTEAVPSPGTGAVAGTGTGASGLRPVEPLRYLDFVELMANAACVLTDSGGIQEETTALGIPCLTLRTSTERPITVTHGTNRIVGLDAAAVADAWTAIQAGDWPAGRLPELWDGKAAERIVAILIARRWR